MIDLAALAQLVDSAQTEAVAKILDRLAEAVDGTQSVHEAVREILGKVDDHGLDVLSRTADIRAIWPGRDLMRCTLP